MLVQMNTMNRQLQIKRQIERKRKQKGQVGGGRGRDAFELKYYFNKNKIIVDNKSDLNRKVDSEEGRRMRRREEGREGRGRSEEGGSIPLRKHWNKYLMYSFAFRIQIKTVVVPRWVK